MANPVSLPLQEKLPRKNTLKRASDLFIFLLLLSLCSYRLLHLNTHGSVWLLALTCESWFTLMWFLMMNSKWNLVDHKTYPDRLIKGMRELPPVDMFVTTADVSLEPAIVTVNTVLSLLAVDYPCHKLACYVSDDGCSPITLYSLIEASKFAQLWVPFCKKYFIRVRAPFMYFSTRPEIPSGVLEEGFLHDWRRMKSDYEELKRKIEEAAKKSLPFPLTGEFAEFSNIERGNHPSIVKVIWENKDKVPNGVPHLVYVAREKRPNEAHHFKAGAMNVLTRVSGVLTNAPFMLNVDCDMFANNPQVILHAMCILLGSKEEKDSGFVQFPQIFYGGLKDDPFGNQMVIANEFILRGIAGIQGPIYGGTGCFHTRKIIYGQPPDTKGTQGQVHEVSRERYGRSWELSKSIVKIMSGMTEQTPTFHCNSSNLKAAEEVASCLYEFDTCWGTEVGWIYGSMTEDVLTGLRIHSLGWTSAFCTPQPPAFLGCAPMGGPACLNQWKRWTTGLLEILIGNHSPLLAAVTKKLKFRQCLVYILCSTWASRSIPEFFYSALPAYCLLSGTSFMPKDLEGRNSVGDEVVQAGDVAGQANGAMEISTSPDSRDKAKGNSLESSKLLTSDEHKSLLPQKKSKKEATECISSPTAFQETTFGGETLQEMLSQYQISNSPNIQVRWRVKMLAHRRNPLIYSRAKQQRARTEGDHKVHKNRKVKKPNKVAKPEEQLGNVGDEQLNEKLHAPQTEPVTTVGLWDKDLQTQGSTSVTRFGEISNEATQNEGDEIIHEEQQKSLHHSSGDHDEQGKVEKANAVDPSCKELSPLPFVKSSPMWKMVESNLVFNTIPQNPHFQPLEQCSEVLREGMAIGQMVAFANVADAICKLHLGDHRSAFENMLKDLAELERHGFNGQLLRARIERLSWLKDGFLESEDKLVETEVQIRGQQRQKDYLNTEVDTLNRDIAILQERRASVIETRKKTEANIERLLQEVQKLKEASRLTEEGFKKVAAAPWSAFRP